MSHNVVKISVAEQFSEFPAGRLSIDGPFSGETFRRKFLIPNLLEADVVEVDLDGTAPYGSSFLEEAFGGLFRDSAIKLSLADMDKKLMLKSSKGILLQEIRLYMREAYDRR